MNSTRIDKNKRSLVYFGLTGCVFVWMWFRPVFWSMTESRDSFLTAILDIFIWPSTPEYMLGAGIDQLGTFWIFGSLPEIFANDGVLPTIFHPVGWDIGWHTGYAWLDGILSLPLQVLGVPAFYNLHVALTLWMSFMGICWLIVPRSSHLITLCIAPIVAAMALWTPFAFEEISMGRPTQLYWIFSAIFLGLLYRRTTEHSWLHTIAVGLSLTASCFVYWFGGVAVGFCGGLIVICQIFQQEERKLFILRNLMAGFIAVGTSILVAHKMIWALLNGANQFEQLDANPVAYLGPWDVPIYTSLQVHGWNHAWLLLQDHPSTLPILFLGLIGCITPFGWKERWPWLVGWFISLGIPVTGAIAIGDWFFPTGQSFLQWIFPLLLRCANPDRMMVAPTLLSIIIFSHAFSASIKRIEHTKLIWPLGLFTVTTLGWMLSPPKADNLKVSSFVVDEVRMHIAEEYPGGMIDVPFSRSENTYIQQLFHKQPVLGGPGLNRVQPNAHVEYCNGNALLKGLEELEQMGETTVKFSLDDITSLIADDFSVLIYDPQSRRISVEQLETHLQIVPDFTHERTGIRAYTLSSLLKHHQ